MVRSGDSGGGQIDNPRRRSQPFTDECASFLDRTAKPNYEKP